MVIDCNPSSESTDGSESIDWSTNASCILDGDVDRDCSRVVTHGGYDAWHPMRLLGGIGFNRL